MATELEDKLAIQELIATYCYLTDRAKDAEAWSNLFTEDGVWDGSAVAGRHEGRGQIRDFMRAATSGGGGNYRHFMSNVLIALDGDSATAQSYFTVFKAGGETPTIFFVGYYDDTFVRQDGRWLFRERLTRSA